MAFVSVLFIFLTVFVFTPKGIFFHTDLDRKVVNTACLSEKENIKISDMSSFMPVSQCSLEIHLYTSAALSELFAWFGLTIP